MFLTTYLILVCKMPKGVGLQQQLHVHLKNIPGLHFYCFVTLTLLLRETKFLPWVCKYLIQYNVGFIECNFSCFSDGDPPINVNI